MKRLMLMFSMLFTVAAACKKNGSDAPANCKISSVSLLPNGGSPEVVNFTYDNSGKLKYMNVGNETVEFLYSANSYRRISSPGNGWSTRSLTELNAAGLPLTKKDTTFNGQNINQTHITTFKYNSQGELINTYKDNNVQPEETFTWANGNLVKYQAGGFSYLMDYYPDKANRDFSMIELQLFVALGTNPAKSRNLLKSLTNNSTQLIFHYQFDQAGNIKKWNATMLGSADTVIRTTQHLICE